MSPQLKVQSQKCTGCRSCMLMCSFAHTDAFSYQESRVQVVGEDAKGQSEPLVCRQCEEAPCIEACPEEAISRDEVTGWVHLDEEECSGCEACLEVCPYQALHMDPRRGVALKCDLCNGDPQCVRVCRLPQALVWR